MSVKAVFVTNATALTFTGGSVNAVQSGAWAVAQSGAWVVSLAAPLSITFPNQGDAGAGQSGPMVQGVVSAAPQSFADGKIQPLSLTADGRLRVVSVQSDNDRVWQHAHADPWGSAPTLWDSELRYV